MCQTYQVHCVMRIHNLQKGIQFNVFHFIEKCRKKKQNASKRKEMKIGGMNVWDSGMTKKKTTKDGGEKFTLQHVSAHRVEKLS